MMNDDILGPIVGRKPSKQEAKADATTRAAREILDGEIARREAKTERLRLARLAKEAEIAAMPAPAKPAPRKKTAKAARG